MLKPKALKKGDTIGIITPSGPVRIAENVDKAVKFVENLGFKVKLGKSVRKTHGFLAGPDEERLSDVHDMFLDDSVDGIFCMKGGYGTTRFSSQIDPKIIRDNPKVFVGYSDITTLHLIFNKLSELITFHGPMPSSDMICDEYAEFSSASFLNAISSTETKTNILNPHGYDFECLSKGKASGQIVGGNLSLIVYSLGTKYEIDTKDKLLFIEDIDEEPHKIDGMLCHLRNCGKLQDAAGFLIGDFKDAVPNKTNPSLNFDEVIRDLLVSTKKPIISNIRAGHCEPKITIPLGAVATMDATNASIIIEESCLAV